MSKMISLTTLAVVSTLGLTMAPAAMASPDPDVVTKKVDVRGLDLSNSRDAQVALDRITRAANAVCDQAYGPGYMYKWARGYRSCVSKAIGSTVASANSSVLTALYDGGPVNTQIASVPATTR